MSIPADLDAEISALAQAVADRDQASIVTRLATIEQALEAMNPLLRGMTYAHVQSVLGRPAQAAAVLDDLLELLPDDAVVHHQLGCYRHAARDHDGALAAFTRATELDAAHVDAWLGCGIVLDERGEPQRAIEAYRQVIVRRPTEVAAWRNLGNSLAALGHYDEAIEAYRTGTQLAAGDELLAFLIASAHQAKGELELANAGLPEAMRAELGEALEVRVQAHGVELRCRFRSRRPLEHRALAEALLHEVAEAFVADADAAGSDPARPWPFREGFVLRRQESLLLCDRDAIRPGPHRFLDATSTITALG